MRRLLRSKAVRVLGIVVVVVAAAFGVFIVIAGDTDPVSEQDALDTFAQAVTGTIPASGPTAGVYRYMASGSERGGAGPFAVTRDVPNEAFLVVTPRPDGWEMELSYSRQHIEAARYRLRDGAIRITWRRTEVTFAGFGRDDRRDVDPPSLFLPAEAAPGRSWSERYRTGDVSVQSETRVLRAERVSVGGAPIDALVIESRATTTGAHPGTRTELLWWAPSLGLPVRWDVDMDIGGVFAFKAQTRLQLASTTPAT